MNKPNLFIAGARKSGTSTLYRMLNKRPMIFLSKQKELDFFNRSDVNDSSYAEYLQNFSDVTNQRYIGEATPHYYRSNAGDTARSFIAERIARFVGIDPAIVLILRNPVERSIAGWRHNYVYGRFDSSTSIFETPPSQGILDLSHYARHWDAWTGVFPKKNFHVCLFDDLATRPQDLLRGIPTKLDLPLAESHYKDFPFGKSTNKVTANMKTHQIDVLPGFELDVVKQLVEMFETDIAHVEGITGRNLDHWRDAEDI